MTEPRKKKRGDSVSLPWGRNPLQGLLGEPVTASFNAKTKIQPEQVKPRKRYYSPLKGRKPCPGCETSKWTIATDDTRYRDPFLVCGGCHETFRLDVTPLDFEYAWRDGMPMPQEVRQKHVTPDGIRGREANRPGRSRDV